MSKVDVEHQLLLHCFCQAISRGVHFEIVYAPMIRDAAARRSTITNGNLLVELCRGKVSDGYCVSLCWWGAFVSPFQIYLQFVFVVNWANKL